MNTELRPSFSLNKSCVWLQFQHNIKKIQMPTCIKQQNKVSLLGLGQESFVSHSFPTHCRKSRAFVHVIASYFHQLHNTGKARDIPHHFISPFPSHTCFSNRNIKQSFCFGWFVVGVFFPSQHLIMKLWGYVSSVMLSAALTW